MDSIAGPLWGLCCQVPGGPEDRSLLNIVEESGRERRKGLWYRFGSRETREIITQMATMYTRKNKNEGRIYRGQQK